jgi:hypothetical protein
VAILTLAEAKRQLKIPVDNTADDVEIQAYCDGITQVIEDYKHEVIEQRTVHRGHRAHHPVRPPVPPVERAGHLDHLGHRCGRRRQTWDVASLR